jgi:hypothetical protein
MLRGSLRFSRTPQCLSGSSWPRRLPEVLRLLATPRLPRLGRLIPMVVFLRLIAVLLFLRFAVNGREVDPILLTHVK